MTLGGLLGFCLSIFSTVEHCYHNNKEDERKKKKSAPWSIPGRSNVLFHSQKTLNEEQRDSSGKLA